MTGYVNENSLCYEGGFPGDGLKELFGIINEEIDTLYPSDRNGIIMGNESMRVKDYAELIKLIDADVIGTYTDDLQSLVRSMARGKHIIRQPGSEMKIWVSWLENFLWRAVSKYASFLQESSITQG